MSVPKFLLHGAVVAMLAAAVFASGCGETDDRSVGSGTTGRDGGTAVVALSGEPDVLNPLIRTTSTSGRILASLGVTVMDVGVDLDWEPIIARTWKMAADSLSLTFHLRPWWWEDGEPLTAHDVAMSFSLYKDRSVASPQRGFFADVDTAVALDDSTLRYDFLRPLPDPFTRTYHNILPRHVVGGLDPAAVGSWPYNSRPLSSGGFVLERWDRNRQVVLVRNPRYPGVRPHLDRVVFRVLPEIETRLLALETGEVDMVDGIPPTAAGRLAESGRVRIVGTSGRQIYYLQWNCARPSFADAATRRALGLALDRERMITSLLGGYGRPAASPVAPAAWNHHRNLVPAGTDPEAAAALLTEAGWRDTDGDGVLERDGVPLKVEILTKQGDPVREQGAVILRENLRRVGAAVTVRVLELGTALDRLNSGSYDAYFGLLNLNVYGDPSPWVHSRSTDRLNKGRYANAEVDSLLDLALGMYDREDALPVWERIQEALVVDPPTAYLFYPDVLVGVGPRLRDVRPHLLSPFNNLSEWWIPEAERRYASGR